MIKTFQLHDIAIEVTRKRIKNLHLKVLRPDGKVKISAPHRMSFTSIYNFALSKFDWIQMSQRKMQTRKPGLKLNYEEGEIHRYLDKNYFLKIREVSTHPLVELENDSLIFSIHSGFCLEKKQILLEKWYSGKLKDILCNLITKWEPVIQVKVQQFFIRKMKTRWGSCSYKTAKIRFNLELAKHSLECIEYIVVHEMVHLLEPSHNHRFKAFMTQFMPEWREHKRKLQLI
jgi:predicted metal-dependent hydrolase